MWGHTTMCYTSSSMASLGSLKTTKLFFNLILCFWLTPWSVSQDTNHHTAAGLWTANRLHVKAYL